ncbi:DUF6183 family protein [Actinoplanes derwentensis]|uniref:Uncharacterized protein n=1 Tax=Actinoplanes derwentensis TaxID=113562 RepID=A0A1H1ZD92_9ACTN|nr:DUF6183 family protein [Actinoplanes derwentensis]GID82372.1 hypothetical protein Ade03nite_12960 [Actinoplanes derwentensis]SDT31527.1 hypothetical protein SAMN04489716_3256 [Actinoplanes derwentensis]
MTEDPTEIAVALTSLDDTSSLGTLVERRLTDGDVRFAVDLGTELWRRYGSEPNPPWQFGSVFDDILRRLALRPGMVTETAEFFTTVAVGRRARYVASLLATEHTASEMRALTGNAELSACLSQELPLRALPPGRLWARPPHPLSWLPLALTPMEKWPDLPRHSLRGTSLSRPGVRVSPVPDGGGPLPSWRETDAGQIAAAVNGWQVEARIVTFAEAVTPHAFAGLGLASTEGLTEGFGVCSAADGWHQLFAAASMGGAYGWGEFGAYGRLAAWRSVAALTGAPPGASAGEVATLAETCTWVWFGGATGWFGGVMWDIGLAVLSADGRRLAVLAATDTD